MQYLFRYVHIDINIDYFPIFFCQTKKLIATATIHQSSFEFLRHGVGAGMVEAHQQDLSPRGDAAKAAMLHWDDCIKTGSYWGWYCQYPLVN